MRKSAAFLSIMLLAECVSIPLHAAERPSCQLTEYESIEFIDISSDSIVFPITIGGNPTYALLNLGSAFNSISPSATDDFQITKQRLRTPGDVGLSISGKRITEITDRVPVSIGRLGFGSIDFLVTTETGIDIPRVTARVGMSLFAGVDVELDFAEKKLKFFSQDHCPGEVVYWSNRFAAVPLRKDPAGGTYLVLELAGKKVEAVLESAGPTYLHAGAAKALFGIDANNRDRPTRQQFMELTANGLSVMNAQVNLEELRGTSCRFREQKGADKAAGYVNCYNIFPLQLGMNVLKKMHIYIATKENVLYFTAADARR